MNHLPDVEPVLRAYLADTGDRAPDRVLEDVAARIAREPRRAWRLRGRPFVQTYVKLAAGLAAVFIVAVVAWQLLPGIADPGNQPTPTAVPTATAGPTTAATAVPSTPSAAITCPTWYTSGCGEGAGILAPGGNTTRRFVPAFTFTVAEGWVNDLDGRAFYGMFPDTPDNRAEFASTGNTHGVLFASALPSPYFFCDAWEDNIGETAADMAAVMMTNEALSTTGVVDVAIGGLIGKQLDVRLNPDWTESCPGDPPGFDLHAPRTRVFFLDVPGREVLVIFIEAPNATVFEPFVAEVMPVIESVEFDLQ